MSTEIRSNEPGDLRVATLAQTWKGSGVVVNNLVRVSSADFLAAVETECGVRIVPADAIVIDRSDVERETLIDAICSRTAYSASSRLDRGTVGNAVDAIYRTLASHPPTPPVDEADVAALAGLVDGAGVRVVANASSRLIARRVLTDRGPNGERVTIVRGESS